MGSSIDFTQTVTASFAISASYASNGGGGTSLSDATATVYVSKDGNDSDNGLNIEAAKLSIGSAITQASSLLTGGADNVRIAILDGGEYTEDITIPDNVVLDGAAASVVGEVVLTSGSVCRINKHYADASDVDMVTVVGGGGNAYYYVGISDGRGTAGAFTGSNNIRNDNEAVVLFARTNVIYVAESGVGLLDGDAGAEGSHTHIKSYDLYLAGNNAKGISANGVSSNIVGFIDHILELGSLSGTTGVEVTANGGQVKLITNEILTDTSYRVTNGGDLALICTTLTGATTGSATTLFGSSKVNVASLEFEAGSITGVVADQDMTLSVSGSANIVLGNDMNTDGNSIRFDGTPPDQTANGLYYNITNNSGQAIGFGSLCNVLDSTMSLATANSASLGTLVCIDSTVSNGSSGRFMYQGSIQETDWDWSTSEGQEKIYKGSTPGTFTQDSASLDYVQVVGVAISPDIIHFQPSYTQFGI